MKNPSLKILLSCILVLSLTASATSREVFETSSIQEWNQGSFSKTSATRNANSGNLGLGYRNGTTSDSLVGYWRLDSSVSGSGGTVKDYSGNKNDGTAKNGVTAGAEGVFSTNSFSFDGSDDYVALDKSFSCSDCFPNGLTVSFWFKRTGTGSNGPDRVGPTFDRSEYFSFIVDAGWTNNNDQMVFSVTDEEGTHDLFSPDPIPLDEWHLWTGVWSPSDGKMYLYRDGNLISSLNSGNNLGSGKTRYGFFNSGSEASSFDGDKNGDHSKGPIDEVKIYEEALISSEVKQLYLRGKPFHGNYTRTVNSGQNQEWSNLEAGSSIPSGTEASAVFRSVDSGGKVLGEEKVNLQDGFKNYSLNVPSSEDFEISFEGNSSNPTESWSVSNFSVYTSGFCDYRGPENECVVNGSNTLDTRTYDISSIFISEESALVESLNGEAVLNTTNETRISGTWRGVFSIKAQKPVIKPGATFRPENGDIVIGER
jgi:hypothetical protein